MEEKELRLKAVEIAASLVNAMSYVSDKPKHVFACADEIIEYVNKTDKKKINYLCGIIN